MPPESPVVATSTIVESEPMDNDSQIEQTTPTPTAEIVTNQQQGTYSGIDPSRQAVKFWHTFQGVYQTALQELIDEFNSSNSWNIIVEESYQGQGDEIKNRMLTFMNSRESSSLIVASESQAATYQLADALIDINQFINHAEWGLSEEERLDYYPGLIDQGISPSFNDSRLTFPLFGQMNVIYYNIDWLAEMGYETYPQSPEAFLDAACMATAQPFSGATASGRSGVNLNISPNSFADWSLAFGGRLFDPGSNQYTFESSQVTAAMTFLQSLVSRGCGTTESQAEAPSLSEAAQVNFSRGVLLFVVDTTAKIPEYRESIQAEANFNWRIAPFPHTTSSLVSNVQGTAASIPKTTPEEELAAWIFLKHLSSPEVQAQWVRKTNALSVRKSSAEFLDDYFSDSPAAQMTLELLDHSTSEPSIPGYDQVQSQSQEALLAIINDADIPSALEELSSIAEQILSEQMALIPESPDPWSDVDPGGQTITFWHQQDESRSASLEEIINEFNATNRWGITVVPVVYESYGEIFQSLLPVFGTEQAPNLVLAYQQHAAAYYEAGGIINMDSLINSTRWGLSPQDTDDFLPAIFKQDVYPIYNSSRLGFPIQRSMDVLYYNADWLRELGYTAPPNNPEEFSAMACAATRNTDQTQEERMGYQFYVDATRFSSWVFAFGGEIFNDSQNQYLLNGSSSNEVISFMQDLISSGCAEPVSDRITAQEAFSESSLLFMVDSSFHIPVIADLVTNNAGFNWSVAPLPSHLDAPVQNLFGASLSIPKNTPESELAAWLFIKYFTGPVVQARWGEQGGYLPVRLSAGDNLKDHFSRSPNYQITFELLPYGVTEPSLPGYDFVRQELELALQAVFSVTEDEDLNLNEILDSLNATANQILITHLEQ